MSASFSSKVITIVYIFISISVYLNLEAAVHVFFAGCLKPHYRSLYRLYIFNTGKLTWRKFGGHLHGGRSSDVFPEAWTNTHGCGLTSALFCWTSLPYFLLRSSITFGTECKPRRRSICPLPPCAETDAVIGCQSQARGGGWEQQQSGWRRTAVTSPSAAVDSFVLVFFLVGQPCKTCWWEIDTNSDQ